MFVETSVSKPPCFHRTTFFENVQKSAFRIIIARVKATASLFVLNRKKTMIMLPCASNVIRDRSCLMLMLTPLTAYNVHIEFI